MRVFVATVPVDEKGKNLISKKAWANSDTTLNEHWNLYNQYCDSGMSLGDAFEKATAVMDGKYK